MSTSTKRTPLLWPLALLVGGVALLLDNFLLIDLDLTPYWPVVLVLFGLGILVRGDIAPSWGAHTFGITRGSVESAAIEIESGEIDVQLQALRKSGRLIAGQYTARSRPSLAVRNNRARLTLHRGQTWWLSLADWDVGLAHDLPWEVLMSSHLGRLDADLRGIQIERAYVASGLGDVSIACPARCRGELVARSNLGDVRVSIPPHSTAVVHVQTGPFGRVRADAERCVEIAPGVYTIGDHAEQDADEIQTHADLTITAATVFGTVHLS
jgi:hypothetical protein